jgi:hypothetical protein
MSRAFVVGVKYGYFPESDYNIVRRGTFMQALRVNGYHMLLASWVSPPDDMLEKELLDAAARDGNELQEHAFTISRSAVLGHPPLLVAFVVAIAVLPA